MALLPEPSVTVQVTFVTPVGKAAGALLVVLATVQLSEVMGVPNITPLAVQVPKSEFTDTAGGQLIFGFSVSLTVTICVQVAVLPEPSITVQMTVVLPKGKLAGALLVTLATVQLSDVTGVPNITPLAEQVPASELTVTATGQVIFGF